jgi:RHS repeat-associated protein
VARFLAALDANGNATSRTDSTGTTNYTLDFENRLTGVTLPGSGGTATFKYDPFGRRVQKVFTQNSTSTTTNYAYDGNDTVEETDQNLNLLAKYARTANIDEPLAESRSGTASYYEADGLGSVTSLSNAAGSLAQTYTFDSFGKVTASSGSLTNRFQYTARELDPETNLYFYRARYMDSSTGRFLSEDRIRFRGGVNFYAYTKNDAVNLLDPSGLLSVCCRQVKSTLYMLCHCFLVLNDNKTTLGGYRTGDSLHPEANWPDDSPVPKRSSCDVIPGAGTDCADSKVRQAFSDIKNQMPPGGYKYFTDGTSNTVSAEILRRAGIHYDFPWCAVGSGRPLGNSAPGIDPNLLYGPPM